MRLLIVEDEVRLATTLCRGLAADGFECEVVHDGAEGLRRTVDGAYAAVVLDLLLPSMNGYTVCRRLREWGNWTPVLILTAKDGDYDLAEALECGADDFLSKPFSFVVLTARLRALIRRGHVPRPPLLEVGDIQLDPFTRRSSAGAAEVALTAREAAVLACLLRRHPGVVTKVDILDEVWGTDAGVDDNIVDVYLRHLRRKLDAAGSSTVIENVRGVGFRLTSHA